VPQAERLDLDLHQPDALRDGDAHKRHHHLAPLRTPGLYQSIHSYCPRNLGFDRQLGVLDLHYGEWRALCDSQDAPRQDAISVQLFALRRGQLSHINDPRPAIKGHIG
jgi:hypothetical protein